MIQWRKHPDLVEYMLKIIPGHTENEIRDLVEREYKITLKKSQIKNFKTRYKAKSGTAGGQFKKGNIPYNKGKKMPSEIYEKVKGTMFKKHHTPHNHREVGSERISKDGYIEIKTKEPNKWELKHRVVYRDFYKDDIKRNEVVIMLDGNKLNLSPENLQKITRAELVRYNQDGMYGSNAELNQVALNIAKLKTAQGNRRRNHKEKKNEDI